MPSDNVPPPPRPPPVLLFVDCGSYGSALNDLRQEYKPHVNVSPDVHHDNSHVKLLLSKECIYIGMFVVVKQF